jgi:hypothetical protein
LKCVLEVTEMATFPFEGVLMVAPVLLVLTTVPKTIAPPARLFVCCAAAAQLLANPLAAKAETDIPVTRASDARAPAARVL